MGWDGMRWNTLSKADDHGDDDDDDDDDGEHVSQLAKSLGVRCHLKRG